MISEVYIEMNQEGPIIEKLYGTMQSLFTYLRHRLCHRTVTFTMLGRWADIHLQQELVLWFLFFAFFL